MAKLLKPSPQTTREWAQLAKDTHIKNTYFGAHVDCLLNSTLSLPDTVIQQGSYLKQCYNHGYTNTNRATVPCVYSNALECKCCMRLFVKVCQHIASIKNTVSSIAEEEQ